MNAAKTKPAPETQPDYAARLQALRDGLKARSLDGFLVPMADEYQSEYVPASARRIEFLSGFTGSAGFIAVLADKAAFFTDSRYTLQAAQQIPQGLFDIHDSATKRVSDWLKETLRADQKIGFDPWLHTAEEAERLRRGVKKASGDLTPVEANPLDAIWTDRPQPPLAPVYAYDLLYAGKSSADKRQSLADELKRKEINAAVITDPASIAWLLNVRGNDVPHTPLPLSFAILRADATVTWFIDPRKLTTGLLETLGPQIIHLHPDEFPGALQRLGKTGQKVRIDPAESAYWIVDTLNAAGAKLDCGDDPCILAKACKNPVELDGMRNAHRRDGAALAKFLAWLEPNAAKTTELQAEEKLQEFRAANNLYRGPSFDTIAGAGPNGAIVHYRATAKTSRKLDNNSLFLLDSGGQYLDGTTDVTRTVAVGEPSKEMRDRYTRVLKGHIALASIRFPSGTTGAELDVLARQFLWSLGLDYGHGTGHGVGSYLGVHEGPQSISRRSTVPLKPGMVLSNEPGYYKANYYGIRIENLQTVIELPEISTPERQFYGFEPLTLIPIDKRPIEPALLTQLEREWLDAYHARVYTALRPQVDEATVEWLKTVTAPL